MHSQQSNWGHKFTVICAVFLSLVFVLLFAKSLYLDPKKVSSPLVGHNAKTFQVEMIQGAELLMKTPAQQLDFSELRGSPLILNFWASWCGSCAEEAALIEEFWQAHKGDGVRILGIAVHDKASDVLSFARSAGKTYALGLDAEGRVALNYGVTGVPETVFIDASGVVVHKEVGPLTTALLEKMWLKIK